MRCIDCRHHQRDPADEMTPLGFVLCPWLPVWQYLSRISTCRLNPPRFSLSPTPLPERERGKGRGAAAA